MKKTVFACALAAGLLLLSAPAGAYAATEDDGYGPGVDDELTLAGSEVSAYCEDDVPWIEYSVVLTDPAGISTGDSARIVMTGSGQSTTIELGELGEDGTLSGRVLWPGASIAADGTPTGWPGWAFVDGEWVETDDNFAWTRGSISTVVEVNPEIPVAISYPPSSPYCTAGPGFDGDVAGEELPSTGSTFDALPLVVGGGLVVVAGAALFAYSRRRAL